MVDLFTIGHSTHSAEQFCALLAEHQIELLADIRRYPGSRKFPHFNRENLGDTLAKAGITYRWFEDLGGRRKGTATEASPNMGLRNQSFRNYADYMLTDVFHRAIDELLKEARARRTAYMCSESVYWRCHRRLVSDFLTARGDTIQHIMPNGDLRPHALTPEAVVADGNVTYPAASDPQGTLFE
ncbi:MAG TPA: DUF488 domain-containing protein [Planctomycetaceae bacterium]|nr:DUF488 domain-containing protein [Planctomycetaceae bacterium]